MPFIFWCPLHPHAKMYASILIRFTIIQDRHLGRHPWQSSPWGGNNKTPDREKLKALDLRRQLSEDLLLARMCYCSVSGSISTLFLLIITSAYSSPSLFLQTKFHERSCLIGLIRRSFQHEPLKSNNIIKRGEHFFQGREREREVGNNAWLGRGERERKEPSALCYRCIPELWTLLLFQKTVIPGGSLQMYAFFL